MVAVYLVIIDIYPTGCVNRQMLLLYEFCCIFFEDKRRNHFRQGFCLYLKMSFFVPSICVTYKDSIPSFNFLQRKESLYYSDLKLYPWKSFYPISKFLKNCDTEDTHEDMKHNLN